MGEMDKPEHIHMLEAWMRSYRPEELFDEHGAVRAEVLRGHADAASGA